MKRFFLAALTALSLAAAAGLPANAAPVGESQMTHQPSGAGFSPQAGDGGWG